MKLSKNEQLLILLLFIIACIFFVNNTCQYKNENLENSPFTPTNSPFTPTNSPSATIKKFKSNSPFYKCNNHKHQEQCIRNVCSSIIFVPVTKAKDESYIQKKINVCVKSNY
jgi:hypothetical protein